MRTNRVSLVLVPSLVLLAAAAASAQQPRLENAQLEERAVAGGLDRSFRGLVGGTAGPAWIGYTAPMVPGEHSMCCYSSNDCCGGCRLEAGTSTGGARSSDSRVRLEGPRHLWVLFRVESQRVEKIRVFSEDCLIDAGGLKLVWLTGVRPEESVALLATFASGEREARRISDGAVSAIAFHAGAAADAALERLAGGDQSESLRERASFWLGNARGRRGYEVLRRMLREDPAPRVREKVIFALTQSKEPEAVPAIIEAARSDSSSHVRGQALFWLGQKAGQKASEAITSAIENDPETEVKKKAVFALSQLPPSEGVPLLIQVARTNRNPAVRKQAVFWLGQSKDARALTFFEEVLSR